MTAGLRVYKQGTSQVKIDLASLLTRLVGSVAGNGSILLPSDRVDWFHYSVVTVSSNQIDDTAMDALSKVTVSVSGNMLTVTAANSITTYIGVY